MLAIACCTFALFSCKKAEDLNTVQENPVFTTTFLLDTQTITLTAGVNGIYLFTRAIRDAQKVYNLSGSFAPAACSDADCPGAFTLRLRTRTIVDSSFSGGSYGYSWIDNPDTVLYQVNMNAFSGFPGAYECFWTINDSLEIPGSVASYTTYQQDLIRVRQRVNQTDVYVSQIERFIAPSGTACPNVDILSAATPGDTTLRLMAIPSAGFNPEFTWSTGSKEILIDVSPGPASAYTVTVTNPQNSCTASASLSVLSWTADIRTANFTVETTAADTDYGAALEWVDSNGDLWSSDKGPQVPGALFQILKAEPYEKNERGEPTRRLHIRYKCRLYRNTDIWKELSGEGVVAVVWPG